MILLNLIKGTDVVLHITTDDMRRWGLEVLNPDLPTKVN